MRKAAMRLMLLVVVLPLVLLPLAKAESFEISLAPEEARIHEGTFIAFNLTIQNNRNTEDQFVISVTGDRIWWYQPGILFVTIPPLEEKIVTLGFYPVGAEQGSYSFAARVKSFLRPEEQLSQAFIIEIFPPVFLTSLDAVLEDEQLKALLGVNSKEERVIEVVFDILDQDGRTVTTLSSTESVAGVTSIEKSIPLPPSPPGSYLLRVSMGEDTLEAGFTMEEIRELTVETITISSTFYDETITRVTNTGNVPTNFETQQTVPQGALITGGVISPTNTFETPTEKIFFYSISLQPGETKEITNRIEKWPVFAELGIVVVIIAVVGILTAGKYTNPRIRKHYRKRGRKTTSVIIGVKNAFSETKNVIVRDWVSPLATVVMEEFEALRPVVRRSDAGTELIWSLGDMKPREERLLSYKIKPIVHGNLKMSKATLRYKNKKGEKKRVHSKPIIIR